MDNGRVRQSLIELGLIRVDGGKVKIGTSKPLPCPLEGYRHNETPENVLEVAPFWIGRTKVTNHQFESVKPKHIRPPQALKNNCPVVDVNYGEALRYCEELNLKYGLKLRLPTEPEWVFAAAPYGWEYIHSGNEPDIAKGHVFDDGKENEIVEAGDSRWPPNFLGLDQIGHNVSEMTRGHYRISLGQYGAETDGYYYIARGGNYGFCKNTLGVHRRLIVDVVDRNPRIGFRLAHDDV